MFILLWCRIFLPILFGEITTWKYLLEYDFCFKFMLSEILKVFGKKDYFDNINDQFDTFSLELTKAKAHDENVTLLRLKHFVSKQIPL